LDVARFVLERTSIERPVILLAPGHPMMFNALSRYLVLEGRRLGLNVVALPGISPLDAIAGAIGLDVATFGLQVFDATRLVRRELPINPRVPAILLHLDGFDATAEPLDDRAPNLEPLVRYLAPCYPPEHAAVV